MRPLSAAQLIDVCERGRGLPPVRQGLLLLQAAYPDEPMEELANLPIGERDAKLLSLRARSLGEALESESTCPMCRERIEFSFRAEDLALTVEEVSQESGSHFLNHGGYKITFRLPNSNDLVQVARVVEPELQLLARCLLNAEYEEKQVTANELPEDVVVAISEAMAGADPQADLQLALTCPACSHGWHALFDIVAYFWAELENWARRLMEDVHRLAIGYGWRESDILSMSAWRRGQYLNLLPT